jgi:hypothetical protein
VTLSAASIWTWISERTLTIRIFWDGPKVPLAWAIAGAQLRRLEECKDWFEKAMAIDEENVRRAAVDDLDPKPLWDGMSGTLWKGVE